MKKPAEKEPKSNQFRDIGWYTDSKGYKHYGAIPLTNEERDGKTRISADDSWLYKELI